MPFNIAPEKNCPSCPFGKCITYIREQSKKMKDRDTQYRLSQKASMACSYDKSIPGFGGSLPATAEFNLFVNQCINNGIIAGKFIEEKIPQHFGNVEEKFFLTPGQVGKVRGDIFEMISRAILWNSSIYLSENCEKSQYPELNEVYSGKTKKGRYAAITLGDNYDLKKIFTKEAANCFMQFEEKLKSKGTSFCYSTPDIIVFRCKDEEMWSKFSNPIKDLSIANQDLLSSARVFVEGKLDPSDIVLAAGIKTSIRSDRMYQLLFEANSWKSIWRKIYDVTPSKYYSVIGQSYGADPEKLNSVEFTSLDSGANFAEKAIDGLVHVSSPFDLIKWYSSAF